MARSYERGFVATAEGFLQCSTQHPTSEPPKRQSISTCQRACSKRCALIAKGPYSSESLTVEPSSIADVTLTPGSRARALPPAKRLEKNCPGHRWRGHRGITLTSKVFLMFRIDQVATRNNSVLMPSHAHLWHRVGVDALHLRAFHDGGIARGRHVLLFCVIICVGGL